MAKSSAPKDEMFEKGKGSGKGADSFARMHKQGGAMHKKTKASRMNAKHGGKGSKGKK